MLTDLRLAARSILKSRGFALIAILTLGLGTGAAVVIFSALHALVLSPFNYPNQEKLVHVWSGDHWPLSNADYLDLHEQMTSFTAFGAYQPITVNIGRENAEAINGILGTADVLPAFGIKPALGRFFTPEEEKSAAPVAILSHGLWQRLMNGDPNAIGRTLHINGREGTVVGVMPPGFEFTSPWGRTNDQQIWMLMSFADAKPARDAHYLLGIARLRDGATVESAEAEVKTIGKRLSEMYPDSNLRKPFLVRSLRYEMTRDVRADLWMLSAAVGLVLLIACGNVASMLLARGARRESEYGVRIALGASRADLLRLALTESLLLALLGSILGVGVAFGGIEILREIAPVSAARKAAMALDLAAFGFVAGATLLTAMVTGLPPALAAARTSIAGVLRSDARGSVGSRSGQRTLRVLIVAQVAVAFVLANGAVLFSNSYLRILAENQLLNTESVVTAQVALPGPTYKEESARLRIWERLVERLRALPGVTQAAITTKLPLEGGSNTNALVNDETYDPTQKRMSVERSSVTEDYFAAMGLKLIKGRFLRAEDRVGDIRGVVVNQELAAKAWPNKDPLGEIMRGNNPGKPWYVARVVGVVENVRQWSADSAVQPEMYTTPEGHWGRSVHLLLRLNAPVTTVVPLIRREVSQLDGELAVKDVRTLHDVVAKATQGQRAIAGLVNFFTITALGLVAVGLYGTLSYSVQQRTREIGVRVAIGAAKHHILGLVAVQGGRWIGMGLIGGILGSIGLASVLKSLVYRMEGLSAPPFLLATAAVTLAGAIACWVPARRAAMVDPLEALRAD